MWKLFFFLFFFCYVAVIFIHFLYPVQGRFSWKSYIVLIKNILNYCRWNRRIHYAYIQLISIVCIWGVIDMQRKKMNYSKSYSMVTRVGVFGAPPGGGEGLGSLRSCQLTHLWYALFQWSSCKPCIQTGHPHWEEDFGIFFVTTSANEGKCSDDVV